MAIYFLVICSRWYIFWKMIGFVGTIWLQALALVWSPSLVGNLPDCMVAQTRSPSVSYNIPLSLLAWGVCVDLLQGLTQRTLYFHWSIDVIWSVLLSSALSWSWEVLVLRISWVLHRHCLLSPSFCLALLVGSRVGFSCRISFLICWRGSGKLDRSHWCVSINGWLDAFMSI